MENISCENIISGKIHGSVSGILIKRIYTISTIGSPNFFSSYFNGDVQIPLPLPLPPYRTSMKLRKISRFRKRTLIVEYTMYPIVYVVAIVHYEKSTENWASRYLWFQCGMSNFVLKFETKLEKFRQMTKNRLIRWWIYALLVQYIGCPRYHKSTSKWDTRNSTIFWNKTFYQSSGILAVCRLSKQQQIEQLLNSIVQKYYMKQSFTEELFPRLCSYFYW